MLLRILGIFIGIYAFAIMTETPRRYLLTAGLVGTASGGVYLVSESLGCDAVWASFFSALTAAVIAHVLARVFKAPVTLFLIAGILPTVPGGGMYRIVANALDGNQTQMLHSLLETLEIAGSIALAIFFVDSFFRLIKPNKQTHIVKNEEP